MALIVKCRACGEMKWKGDICPTADFTVRKDVHLQRVSNKYFRPIRVMVKHGFHAENQTPIIKGVA